MIETPQNTVFEDAIALRTLNCSVGVIETNAKLVLEAVKERIASYQEIDRYIGHIDTAKDDRAALRKQKDLVKQEGKAIEARWNAPLDQFKGTVKEILGQFDIAINSVDELVKSVEEREKAEKRRLIQDYFNTKQFDLVSLDKLFNQKWLNKTAKMPEIRKELDVIISDIYANIKVLERIPDYGVTAKTLYLDTLDMAAALRQIDVMKANAERLAKEQAEREERERQEQVERNRKALEQEKRDVAPPSKRMNELVREALDIPLPEVEVPQKPEIMEFTLRFRGTKEKLFALKVWMNENDIAYEKIG
jgi:hypothetical protein